MSKSEAEGIIARVAERLATEFTPEEIIIIRRVSNHQGDAEGFTSIMGGCLDLFADRKDRPAHLKDMKKNIAAWKRANFGKVAADSSSTTKLERFQKKEEKLWGKNWPD